VVVGLGAVILVARSGNFGLPVLPIEERLRTLTGDLLVARPRTKEYLIGHPALVLAAAAAAAGWRLAGAPLAAVGAIGQAGIVGADLFISGGGSLVQDVTSARGALYYLGLLGLATRLAHATMVFAAGIGPLRRGWLRALARRILNRVTLITVRDEGSRRLLQQLAVHRPVQVV